MDASPSDLPVSRISHLPSLDASLDGLVRKTGTAAGPLIAEPVDWKAVPAVLFTNRPDGECDSTTDHFYEFTGLPPGSALGWGWVQALHSDDAERTRTRWVECVRSGEGFELDFRLRRHDGAYRWFRGRSSPVRDAAGKVVRWFGVCMDIHDQREVEAAARQSQKLESIGLLASGIAHDFNNLLTGILGNASLALHAMPQGSPAARMVGEVVKASRRAAALTGQLLAYAGKGQSHAEPVDLAKLVHEISGLLRASLPKKVSVKLELRDALPPVKADPSQLQQVIMNLVINGAESIGPRSGTVRLRTEEVRLTEADVGARFPGFDIGPGAYVRLEVSDNGSGMDPETLARIFDPFFTTKFMGRGLGLAATLGIVRGHRGAIAVHSEPGEGSVFSLILPATTTAADRTEPPAEVEGRRGTEVILVADDEEVVRRTARAALEGYGYRVLEAADGVEALECFRQRSDDIALALLDMTMPAMSGDEAARHCLRIRPDLPIIASSGYGEVEAKRRFSDIAIGGFLQKPYSAEQLVDLVSRLLGSPAA